MASWRFQFMFIVLNKEAAMGLKWTDTRDLAIALSEKYPDVNPMTVRFTDLHEWVIGLPDFEDKPERSGEKILEAIQMAWMDEHGG